MPDYLIALPALVKILGAFGAILLAARLKLHLGLSMGVGTVVLGLWCGLSPTEVLGSLGNSGADITTWGLVLLVSLIVVFGKLLQLSGRLDRMVSAVVARAGSRRRAAALLPTLLGLLPMPGGAYLSAPMVDSAARADGIRPERLAAINYWFRHTWEYCWPLYPGVIVAVSLLEQEHPGRVNVGWFMFFQLPLPLIVFMAGKLFLLGGGYRREKEMNGEPETRATTKKSEAPSLFKEVLPILMVVGLTLTWCLSEIGAKHFGIPFPSIPKAFPLSAFILLGIFLIFKWDRIGTSKLPGVLKQKRILDMVGIILGVMVFKGMISDSNAVGEMSNEIQNLPLSPQLLTILLLCALPFVAGVVTGIAVGFVGASFPVVVGLMPHDGGPVLLAAAYVLAFGCGYTGMMLSPVHFCLVLTKEYFKADLRGIYRLLVSPALFLVSAVILLSTIYWFLAR